MIRIPEDGPPDVYAKREMKAYDALPVSVRKRLDMGKAGEICPAQVIYDLGMEKDEGRCHKFMDDVERTHRKNFGGIK